MTRELIDYILARAGIVLLVLWAGWATWQHAILFAANQQQAQVIAQQQATYGQLQQQAQQAVNQLQTQLKQAQGAQP